MAKVTVEFTGRVEISTQGWSDETKLDQIKKQAKDAIKHWTFMVKKGGTEPVAVNFVKAEVTEVIIDI